MGNKNSSANTNATEEPQQIVATPQMQQQQQMPVKNVRRQNYSNVSYSKPAPVVSNNRSVYDDDDAIAAPELAKGFTSKSLYDLAKGLKFGLKPIQKAFKLNSKTTQTVPAMITLKTLDSTDEGSKKSEDIDMAGRPSVDLICVIDHSGSMSGTKIELVRKTLVSIIDFLNEKDRICLIEFDDQVNRLTNLKCVSKGNKSEIMTAIESLRDNGGTNVALGMEHAFKCIKERKFRNQVTSVFLLSDGLDGGAETRVMQALSRASLEDTFTINTFGFGSDHDPKLMTEISKLKDGNFYFIEKLDKIDECFADALGALFSIVAQDVKISMTVKRAAPFTDHQISKTYGPMWMENTKDGTFNIEINQLISGVSKEYIFEVSIPPISSSIGDHERNAVWVEASLSARQVGDDSKPPIKLSAELIYTVFNETEEIPPDSEIDEDVLFNVLRVRGAEVIETCMQNAEKRDYDRGQQVVEEFLGEIQNSKPATQEKLNGLVRDLNITKESCKPRVYEEVGSKRMMNMQKCNMEQRSQAVEQVDMYSNVMQTQMKTAMRSQQI